MVSEDSKTETSALTSRPIRKNLFCFQEHGPQLLLEDDSTIKYYQQFIPSLFESKSFSFIQKAAMLSLIEMSRRPDEASPSARLQFFLRYKNNNYYFDFVPKDIDSAPGMPYLTGVETLLKNFDSTKGLGEIAEKLDTLLPPNLNVSQEFESFLYNNRADLIKNDFLASVFFKGDEVLTKHESFKRISLKKLIAYYRLKKLSDEGLYFSSKNSLSTIATDHPDLSLKCNVNIDQENYGKEGQDQKKSHSFSLKEGNNYFIAVSSAIVEKPFETYDSTYFFKAKSSSLPLPVCHLKNKRQDLILFSTTGRDPAQHLKHLISYDLHGADSFLALGELLNFSRHLFLDDPGRILYESKRGRKSQLDFFLSMNFPIYHVETLGDIIGAAAFKNGNREDRSLIVDERGQAKIWCER